MASAALHAFIAEADQASFAFGHFDCGMALANWVMVQTGRHPAPHLRGTYRSERGWREIVIRAGGLFNLVNGLALAAGLSLRRQEGEAYEDDIGIIRIPIIGHTGAIMVDGIWHAKMQDGPMLRFGEEIGIRAAWGF